MKYTIIKREVIEKQKVRIATLEDLIQAQKEKIASLEIQVFKLNFNQRDNHGRYLNRPKTSKS